jgi:hypothetical protein
MQQDDPAVVWSRKYYRPGGGNAVLLYVIFGNFDVSRQVDAEKYRTTGMPEGVEIRSYNRQQHYSYIRSMYEGGWLGQYLKATSPAMYAGVDSSPQCLLVRGEIPDPDSLLYLRNTIGLMTALMDGSGVAAILDMPALTWHTKQQWFHKIFAPDQPLPQQQAVILTADEEDGDGLWIHTCGMRKFGRPDVSIRNVALGEKDAYIDLCNRFIEMMAFGEVVAEGQAVKMKGLPEGLTCHLQGSLDDPEFNNVHFEVRRG